MQERVAALGGTCTIGGAAAGGTRVHVIIPLPSRDEGPG
jgi:signal transduction histidine kinase